MTGFLENLNAQVATLVQEVEAIKARLNSQPAQQPATGLPGLTNGSGAGLASADPFAGLGGTPTPTPTPAVQVTDEMVMKLVSDNVQNEAVKAAMQNVLVQMGIPRLSETRPDQLPDLYQRLSAVVAAAGAATQQPGLTGSII